jgi:hypothetical protein
MRERPPEASRLPPARTNRGAPHRPGGALVGTLSIAVAAFAAVVLSAYYVRLWELLATDPRALAVVARESIELYRPLRFPFLREAVVRASAGLAGAACLLLAAVPIGLALARPLAARAGSASERVLFRLALGLAGLSWICLALAAAGAYRPAPVRGVVVALAVAGAIRCAWSGLRALRSRGQRERRDDEAIARRVPSGERTSSARTGGAGAESIVSNPDAARAASDRETSEWIARAFVVVPLALAVAFAWVGALAPEVEYDALWYHLWLPRLWLQAGAPVDIVHEYVSLYPLAWQLLYGAGLTLGGPVSAKLLHFAAYALLLLATARLAARLLPLASPRLAAALVATAPTVLWEATTAYVDVAVGLYVTVALLAVAAYCRDRSRAWIAAAAIALGMALATKHLALLALVLLASGLWWLERRVVGARRAWRPAVLFVALALLQPLPWYLRSWAASGNPVFPDLYGVFGARPPERWDALTARELQAFEDRFGRPRTPRNLATLPWDVTVHGARYGGSFGPLLLVLLPGLAIPAALGGPARRSASTVCRRPAVCASTSASPPRAPALLGAFAAGYIALWATPLGSFQARFLVPGVAVHRSRAAARCAGADLHRRRSALRDAEPPVERRGAGATDGMGRAARRGAQSLRGRPRARRDAPARRPPPRVSSDRRSRDRGACRPRVLPGDDLRRRSVHAVRASRSARSRGAAVGPAPAGRASRPGGGRPATGPRPRARRSPPAPPPRRTTARTGGRARRRPRRPGAGARGGARRRAP